MIHEVPVARLSPLGDASTLRQFAGQFPTGVAVVTTRDEEGALFGATMNSVTSLSLDPPLYLMCFQRNSVTFDAMQASGVFGMSFLARGQEHIAAHFAKSGRGKFETVSHSIASAGVPIIDGAAASCIGRVSEIHQGGDHAVVFATVDGIVTSVVEPLVFHKGGYRRLEPI